MTTKKNPQQDYPTEFEQGRRARLSGVSKEEAPYADVKGDDGKTIKSKALDAWEAGYDAAEGEAARNQTMSPDEPPVKAEGQVATVSK